MSMERREAIVYARVANTYYSFIEIQGILHGSRTCFSSCFLSSLVLFSLFSSPRLEIGQSVRNEDGIGER